MREPGGNHGGGQLAQGPRVSGDSGNGGVIDDTSALMEQVWPMCGPPNAEAQRKTDAIYHGTARKQHMDAAWVEPETVHAKTDVESESILQEAQRLIHGDRQAKYGHPSVNYKRVAEFWTDYLVATGWEGPILEPHDVPMMMALLKLCRLIESPTDRDGAVDVCGYMGTIEMLWGMGK